MNNIEIYTGTIMKCTKCERKVNFACGDFSSGFIYPKSEVYKENAILVKTSHDYYIDVDSLHLLQIPYLLFENKKSIHSRDNFMSTGGYSSGEIYVDEETVKPYDFNGEIKKPSLLSLKMNAYKSAKK